jgi:hypothetical protein
VPELRKVLVSTIKETGMGKVRKVVVWLLVDGALWSAAVAGVVLGVEWAANLFKFLTVLAALLAVFVAVVATIITAVKPDDFDWPEHPARRLARWTDFALMLFLAAHGWFFYATLVGVQIACSFWVGAASDGSAEKAADAAPTAP